MNNREIDFIDALREVLGLDPITEEKASQPCSIKARMLRFEGDGNYGSRGMNYSLSRDAGSDVLDCSRYTYLKAVQ